MAFFRALGSARTVHLRAILILTAAVLAAIGIGAALAPEKAIPQARSFGGTAAVGALFTTDPKGNLGYHFCTGSVVNSPKQDLVLTAAHCLSGVRVNQLAFVPGYLDGEKPYGVWSVERAVVDRAWSSSASPDDDFAFLVVRHLLPVVGERLGIDEPAGQRLDAIAYPEGSGAPVRCESLGIAYSADQLQFDCGGFPAGTSGAPLLLGVNASSGLGTVIGVIGGFQLGGESSDISYAARFGARLATLYRAAENLPAPPNSNTDPVRAQDGSMLICRC